MNGIVDEVHSLQHNDDLVSARRVVERVDEWIAGLIERGPGLLSHPGYRDEIDGLRGELRRFSDSRWARDGAYGVMAMYIHSRVGVGIVATAEAVAAVANMIETKRPAAIPEEEIRLPTIVVRRIGQHVVRRNGRARVTDRWQLLFDGWPVLGHEGSRRDVCRKASFAAGFDAAGQPAPMSVLSGKALHRARRAGRKTKRETPGAPMLKARHGGRRQKAWSRVVQNAVVPPAPSDPVSTG